MLWGLVLEDGGCRAAPGLSLSSCRSRTDAVALQSSLFMKGDDDVLYLTYNDIIGQFRHTNRSLLLERIEIVVISLFTAGVESQQLLSSAHRLQLSFFLFSVASFSCPRSLRQVRGPVILPGAPPWPLPLSHSFVFQGGNEAARSRPLFQNVSQQRVQSEQRWRTDITAAIDNLPWHAVIFLSGGVTSQRFEIQKWDVFSLLLKRRRNASRLVGIHREREEDGGTVGGLAAGSGLLQLNGCLVGLLWRLPGQN